MVTTLKCRLVNASCNDVIHVERAITLGSSITCTEVWTSVQGCLTPWVYYDAPQVLTNIILLKREMA